MAHSKLTLPGDFEPDKNYLLKGSTLLAWRKALLADRAIPGPGLEESATPQGRILSLSGGEGGSTVADLNLTVVTQYFDSTADPVVFMGRDVPFPAPDVVYYIRNGVLIGTDNPGNPPGILLTQTVTRVQDYSLGP